MALRPLLSLNGQVAGQHALTLTLTQRSGFAEVKAVSARHPGRTTRGTANEFWLPAPEDAMSFVAAAPQRWRRRDKPRNVDKNGRLERPHARRSRCIHQLLPHAVNRSKGPARALDLSPSHVSECLALSGGEVRSNYCIYTKATANPHSGFNLL